MEAKHTAEQITAAQQALDLHRANSPYWDSPRGQHALEIIKDCSLVASVSADKKGEERNKAIGEAVAYYNGKWPDELWSGVMFFNGERISLGEFYAQKSD